MSSSALLLCLAVTFFFLCGVGPRVKLYGCVSSGTAGQLWYCATQTCEAWL